MCQGRTPFLLRTQGLHRHHSYQRGLKYFKLVAATNLHHLLPLRRVPRAIYLQVPLQPCWKTTARSSTSMFTSLHIHDFSRLMTLFWPHRLCFFTGGGSDSFMSQPVDKITRSYSASNVEELLYQQTPIGSFTSSSVFPLGIPTRRSPSFDEVAYRSGSSTPTANNG